MVWFYALVVFAAFLTPFAFSSGRRKPDPFSPVAFGFMAFIAIQFLTSTSSEREVSLSEIDHATVETGKEKTLYVKHPKDSYQTDKQTIVENIGDTTQVEILLERWESGWFGPNYYLKVQSK